MKCKMNFLVLKYNLHLNQRPKKNKRENEEEDLIDTKSKISIPNRQFYSIY